jgi:hypothetical protein
VSIIAIGLDYLNGTSKVVPEGYWTRRVAFGLVGGVLGSLLWPKHRVLGALLGHSAATTAFRLTSDFDSRSAAIADFGSSGIATAAALTLPIHPAVGYTAGLISSRLLWRSGDDE